MTPAQEARLHELVGLAREKPVLVMTGAGVSAESGIPTFRGEEGYWKVGSRNYHPQELASWAAWTRMPDELWSWYLNRYGVCRAAEPNAAHHALARLEAVLENRFRLVTQNVDGLHLRAGNSEPRTYQIHGHIDVMRCASECSPTLHPTPDFGPWPKERRLIDDERARLVCPECGARTRPHVLWFDESYDEQHYRWNSSLDAAHRAALLVVIGTSGATTLPNRIAEMIAERGRPFIAINRDPSPFTELAEASPRGLVLLGAAGEYVPRVVDALLAE